MKQDNETYFFFGSSSLLLPVLDLTAVATTTFKITKNKQFKGYVSQNLETFFLN
jgi:hypothetical protein